MASWFLQRGSCAIDATAALAMMLGVATEQGVKMVGFAEMEASWCHPFSVTVMWASSFPVLHFLCGRGCFANIANYRGMCM
uniref:Putative secreted protein n=1 Tax=Anopheles marajoara TaxID=58244 RepID=A0A2M4CBF7_9DIPT